MRAVTAAGITSTLMAVVVRVAPILPVRDLDASLDHYQRLGFATRKYSAADYGFAERNGVELHLGVSSEFLPSGRGISIYLFVDDADALADEWRAAGVEVHGPEDTDWGQHEGAHVDPDGNVLRFGSPMARG